MFSRMPFRVGRACQINGLHCPARRAWCSFALAGRCAEGAPRHAVVHVRSAWFLACA